MTLSIDPAYALRERLHVASLRDTWLRYACAAGSGALYFLGWPGFDMWGLSFVAFVPLLWALERVRTTRGGPSALALGLVAGVVKSVGGFTWLFATLQSYSRMPAPVCGALAALAWLYQGTSLALFAWLYVRARAWRLGVLVASMTSIAITEWVFPEVFPHYFGLSLHAHPIALQSADVLGPLGLSVLLIAANVAMYALVSGFREARASALLAALALWTGALAYGQYRIAEVDRRAADARKLEVAIIQSNLSVADMRRNLGESLRTHLQQSARITPPPGLLVWPETVLDQNDLPGLPLAMFFHNVSVPILHGARLVAEGDSDVPRHRNAAHLVDAHGTLLAAYHKQKLLPLGEHMPFADQFPALRALLPRARTFVAGELPPVLTLGDIRIGVSICYEDIFARFLADGVARTKPHLLVNLTNDAWFGDTREPRQHLALAKLRAVEHHRTLVRATNSGVSAFVDPVGRELASSDLFAPRTLTSKVPLLDGDTVYGWLGDAVGYLAVLVLLAAFVRRRASPRGV